MAENSSEAIKGLLGDLKNATIIHGDNSIVVAKIYTAMGEQYLAEKSLLDARGYFTKSLNMLSDLLGSGNEDVIDAHYRLGKVIALQTEGIDNREARQHALKTRQLREQFDATIQGTEPSIEIDDKFRITGDVEAISHTHRTNITNVNSVDSTMVYSDLADEAKREQDYDTARQLYIKCLDLRKKKYGDRSPAITSVMMSVAEVYKLDGNYKASHALLDEVLSITNEVYGFTSEPVAETLHSLGHLLRLKGDLDAAEPTLMEALKIRRMNFGDYHPNVGATLNNLADVFREKNDFLQALQFHASAVEAFERSVGKSHVGYINSQGNMGITLRRQAMVGLGRGEDLVKSSLEFLSIRGYDSQHPWVSKFTNEHLLYRAQHLHDEGRYVQAAEVFSSIIASKNKEKKAKTGLTATDLKKPSQEMSILVEGRLKSQVMVARELTKRSLFSQADEMLAEGVVSSVEILGPDYPLFTEIALLRADLALTTGRYDAARSGLLELLTSRTDAHGPDHIDVAEVMVPLGEWHLIHGMLPDAETILLQALTLISAQMKREPEVVQASGSSAYTVLYVRALSSIADLYFEKGHYSTVLGTLGQLSDVCSKSFDKDDPVTLRVLSHQANRILLQQGKYKQAGAILHSILETQQRLYGKDTNHYEVAMALKSLGNFELVKGQDLASARKYTMAATDMLHSVTGSNGKHVGYLELRLQMGEIFLEMGSYSDAAQQFSFCVSGCIETLGEDCSRYYKSRCLLAMATFYGCLNYNEVQKELSFVLEKQRQMFNNNLSNNLHSIGDATAGSSDNNTDVVQSLLSLGEVLRLQGKVGESMRVCMKALSASEAIFKSLFPTAKPPDTSVLIIDCKLCIARLNVLLGSFREASESIGMIGIDVTRLTGGSSVRAAKCYLLLGEVLSVHKAKYKDARTLISRSIAYRSKLVSGDISHPLLMDALLAAIDNVRIPGYLEAALADCDKVLAALAARQKSAQERAAISGDTNNSNELCKFYLSKFGALKAKILLDLGRIADAEPFVVESLKAFADIFCSENGPDYLSSLATLAHIQREGGSYDKAAATYKQALQLARGLYGEVHPVCIDLFRGVALLALATNKEDDALVALEKNVLVPCEQLYGNRHPETYYGKGLVGLCRNLNSKESGNRAINEALAEYASYGQLKFTALQPWVADLGGFSGSGLGSAGATSDKSTAHADAYEDIQSAVAPWCLPLSPSDDKFGNVPPDHSILTNTDNPSMWGAVNYTKRSSPQGTPEKAAFNSCAASSPGDNSSMAVSEKSLNRKVVGLGMSVPGRSGADMQSRPGGSGDLHTKGPAVDVETQTEVCDAAEGDAGVATINGSWAPESAANPNPNPDEGAIVDCNESFAKPVAEVAIESSQPVASPPRAAEDDKTTTESAPLVAPAADAALENEQERGQQSEPILVEGAEIAAEKIEIADSSASRRTIESAPKPAAADEGQTQAAVAADFLLARAAKLFAEGGFANHSLAQPLLDEACVIRGDLSAGSDVEVQAVLQSANNLQALCKWREASAMYNKCHAILTDLASSKLGYLEPITEVNILMARNFVQRGLYFDAQEVLTKAQGYLSLKVEATNALVGLLSIEQSTVSLRLASISEARALAEKAFAIINKAYGSKHIAISDCLCARAAVLAMQAKYNEAKPLLDQALIIRRELLGPSHPAIAACYMQQAAIFMEQGKAVEAFPLLQRALDIYKAVHKNDRDVRLTEILQLQAVIMSKNGQYSESAAATRAIIASREALLEAGHCWIADSLLALSDVQSLEGDYESALTSASRCLSMRRGIFTPQAGTAEGAKAHHLVADALHAVGEICRRLGRFDEAKADLDAAEEMRRAVYTKNHPKYFTSQHSGICLLLDLNGYESAMKSCEKVMKARSDSLGDDHPDFGDSLLAYGRILLAFGDVDSLTKAKAAAKEALQLCKLNYGPSSVALAECIQLQCAIELALLEPHRKPDDKGPETEEDCEGEDGEVSDEVGEALKAESLAMDFKTDLEGVPIFPSEPFDHIEQMLHSAVASLGCVDLGSNPLGIFIHAFFGAIKRSLFDAETRFVDKLPIDKRKLFREKQKIAALSAGGPADDGDAAIPGLAIIEDAIAKLRKVFASASNVDKHPYIVQLKKFTGAVVREKSDLQEARTNFKLAEVARKNGHFYEAERYYNDCFSQQVESTGVFAASTSIEVADILIGRAENLRALGRYWESQQCYVQFIVICEKTCGSESALTAQGYFGLAELLRLFGKFDESRALHEKVLLLRTHCLGSDGTLPVAKSHRAIADLSIDTGFFAAAEKHIKMSLEMREEAYGSGSHEEVVESMLTMARLYLVMNRIDESAELADRALKIAVSLRGEEHALAAGCLHAQASLALQRCDFPAANKLSKRVIKIYASSLGNSSKRAETNRGNGRFFETLSKLTKSDISLGVDFNSTRGRDKSDCYTMRAQQLLECGAFIYAGNSVVSHPLIAASLLLRAELALATGQIAESIEMFKYSKNMLCDAYGCLNFGSEQVNSSFGRALIVSGDYKMASWMIGTLHDLAIAHLPDSHPISIDAAGSRGDLCSVLNQLPVCETLLPRCLELCSALYGAGHAKTAFSQIACANVLTLRSMHSEAMALYSTATQSLKKIFPEAHLFIAQASYHEANGALAAGSYAHAAALIDKAMGIGSMLLGEGHYLVHLCLHSLAELQRLQGKFLFAKKTVEQALASKQESLGALHPLTVGSILLSAHIYRDLAKYPLAARVYLKIVRFIRRCYGDDHVVLAEALRGLALTRVLEGEVQEGTTLHTSALRIARQLFGDASSRSRSELVLASLQSLGEIAALNGQLQEAEVQLEEVFASCKDGEKTNIVSRPVASSLAALGDVYLLRGKVSEARSMYERCLSMRRALLGGDHPDVVESQIKLAIILQTSGKLQQAAEAYDRCYVRLRDGTGAGHPLVGLVLGCRGVVLTRLGRYSEAYSLLTESLSIKKLVYEKHYPQHMDLLEGYYNLAEYYKAMGNYGDLSRDVVQQERLGRYVMSFDEKLRIIDEKSTLQAPMPSSPSSVKSVKSGKSSSTASASSAMAKILAVDVCESVVESSDAFEDDKIREAVDEEVLKITNNPSQFAADAEKATAVPFLVFEKVESAMEIYKNVLDAQIAFYGVDHPRVVKTQFAIAENLKLRGAFDIALDVFEHVYGARRKLYGEIHIETAEAMCGLADMLRAVAKFFPTAKEKGRGETNKAIASGGGRVAGPKLEEHLGSIIGTSGPLLAPLRPRSNLSPLNNAIRDKASSETLILRPAKKAQQLPAYLGGYMGYAFPSIKGGSKVVGAATAPKGSNLDAKALYDSAIAVMKELFGDSSEEHPLLADLVFGKAELCKGRGDTGKSLPLTQTALALRRRIFHLSHPSVAMCVNLMAELLRIDSRYADAITLYDKSIEILKEAYTSGSHPLVAEVTNNLAMCYYGYGRYSQAKALYEEAISLRKQLLGEHHPAVAQSTNNYASLLHILGKHPEAERLYQQSLGIKKAVFGLSHPDVATVLNNYALLLKAMGRLDESEGLYQECVKIQRESLGEHHPDLASTYNNLAALYVEKNQFVEAIHLCRKSIDMKRKIFGLNSVVVAGALTNYAGLLYNMKEYADAQDLYKEALKIRRSVNGESHPSVAESLNNIALLHFMQDDFEQAKLLYEQALQIKVTVYGGSSPSVISGYTNLAGCLLKLGSLKESLSMFKKALELKTRQMEIEAGEAAADNVYMLPAAGDSDAELYSIEMNIASIQELLEYERNNLNSENNSVSSPADGKSVMSSLSPSDKRVKGSNRLLETTASR